jgi:hypothetical protein
MKLKLAFALAVLFFASQAHADIIQTSTGSLTIPDGSTVTATSIIQDPDGPEWGNTTLVDYSFAGGTGTAEGNFLLGYWGTIDFSSPVSDVSFNFIDASVFIATDNVGDIFGSAEGQEEGTVSFPGPEITQINWQGGDEVGGITSLDSTPDSQSVPEPSSLMLSGIGLAALIALARRNRPELQMAMVSAMIQRR